MRTRFAPERLAEPSIADAERQLRACVHCGMCNAVCPTYRLIGDEADGPRGRIRLMQDMLERGGPPAKSEVRHIDRCLSCLACRTTCPSSVDYRRLVDAAREHIAAHHRRPFGERQFRALLAWLLPRPWAFGAALRLAPLAKPLRRWLPERLRALAETAPAVRSPARSPRPGVYPARGERRMRVALLRGCVQRSLAPEIDQAAVRLLTRLGAEVIVARGSGCCGAISHHLGLTQSARDYARRNVAAWGGTIDRVVVTASGCGAAVRDYAHLLAGDGGAARVSERTRDIAELAAELGYAGRAPEPLRVAYHAACSLTHGQRIGDVAERLLGEAGFALAPAKDADQCCGSAGTYSLLQPEIAGALRVAKIAALTAKRPQAIASGNIGCLEHLRGAAGVPMVHTVELLDWAAGGPKPWRLV